MIDVVYTWKCLEPGCDEHGEGPASFTQSVKHTKATSHATLTSGAPSG